MDFNSIFFPKPEPSYDKKQHKEIIEIKSQQNQRLIPCWIGECQIQTKNWIIYFHGNAEDLYYAAYFMQQIQEQIVQRFPFNFLAVEYPGYGSYQGYETTATMIEEDALTVYEYVNTHISNRIILFGRSMGSGPACFLAEKNKAHALILMSAYSSLRSVAQDHVYFLACLVSQRFENQKRAANIKIPTLIIHGDSDTLINCKHSKGIFNNLKSEKKMEKYPKGMTHNDFDLDQDICANICEFIQSLTHQTQYL